MTAKPVVAVTAADVSLRPDAVRVRDALLALGLETPMVATGLNTRQKHQRIRGLMSEVMNALGLNLADDSLAETPHRIAKMFVDEVFSGLDYANFPRLSLIENKFGDGGVVTVSDIAVVSTCEHHFVTIDGLAKVAYLPGSRVIGLSKLNRIVRFFCQRPQIQERLTRQVLVALQTVLETDDVAVTIDAIHYCVKARGVMDAGSRTETVALGGCFRDDSALRAEFLRR